MLFSFLDCCCIVMICSGLSMCSYMAAGLWLAAVTLHDVMEGVSLFGDL